MALPGEDLGSDRADDQECLVRRAWPSAAGKHQIIGLAIGGPLGGLVAGTMNAAPFAIAGVAALLAMVPIAVRTRRMRAEICGGDQNQ